MSNNMNNEITRSLDMFEDRRTNIYLSGRLIGAKYGDKYVSVTASSYAEFTNDKDGVNYLIAMDEAYTKPRAKQAEPTNQLNLF